MSPDPEAAYERRQQRERLRRRRDESRRDDLRHAASQMIPDHGLALTLGQIATVARLSRPVATALYASVADLAVDVVCRAWRALIEATAPTPDMTTEDFLARLIQALRADEVTHRVWQTIQCGLLERNRRAMVEAEAFLTRCIGEALREIRKDIPYAAAAEVADRVLSLARHSAYAASAPDPRAEAALIAALLPHFYKASAEATAPVEAVAAPVAPPRAEIPPAEVSAPPAWTLPQRPPNGHDPPRRMAGYQRHEVLTGPTLCRHCERSEAIQSSVPHGWPTSMWLGGAMSDRAASGREDRIASSLLVRFAAQASQ